MSSPEKYAVCFAGARDNYEAAVALQQHGALECLLTDLYLQNPRVAAIAMPYMKAATPRSVHELADADVRNCLSSFLVQKASQSVPGLRHILPFSGQEVLSREFGHMVARSDAHVFAYAGYALHAFRLAGKRRKKVLFQYHPHRALEQAVLKEDDQRWKGILPTSAAVLAPPDDRNSEEISLADLVICASSVTKASLAHQRSNVRATAVVPYGSNFSFSPDEIERGKKSSDGFTALFVGSGVRRKGLHTLVEAWQNLPHKKKKLTIVAKGLEPDIAQFIRERAGDDVELLGAQSRENLKRLFLESQVFILPSLMEGFGHVILEALSSGCFVIASDGTCLPDVLADARCGIVCRRGDVDDLRRCITEAIDRYESGGFDRGAILAQSRRASWQSFRQGLLRATGLLN